MKWIESTGVPPSEWNEFAASCPNASILQSAEWGHVKSGTWTPFRVRLCADDGSPLVQALVLKRTLPATPFSILYVPRGPLARDWSAIPEFSSHILDFAKRHRALAVRCDPEIVETDPQTLHHLLRAGWKRSSDNIQPRGTIILDIDGEEEALLASFHHKTRYNIRLAFKKGVTVEEMNSAEGVDRFYELFRVTADRDHFMILSKAYFHRMRETLAASGLCTLFVARLGEEPLAAIFQTIFANRMTYLYGASSNRHRNLMPNHAIHWHAIQWARSRGITKYDLWGIPAQPQEGHPLWGVYRFKKGFSETETKWIGTLEMIRRPILYRTLLSGIRGAKTVLRFLKTGTWKSSLEE